MVQKPGHPAWSPPSLQVILDFKVVHLPKSIRCNDDRVCPSQDMPYILANQWQANIIHGNLSCNVYFELLSTNWHHELASLILNVHMKAGKVRQAPETCCGRKPSLN